MRTRSATTRATLLRTTNAKTFDYDVVTWARLGVKNWYTHPLAPKIPDLSVANGPRIGGGDPRVSGQVTPGVGNATVGLFPKTSVRSRAAIRLLSAGLTSTQRLYSNASTDAVGSMTFVATNTGLGLGDFMTGQLESFRQSRLQLVVSEPALLRPLPAGHLEGELPSDSERGRPMGALPFDARKAKKICLFRQSVV